MAEDFSDLGFVANSEEKPPESSPQSAPAPVSGQAQESAPQIQGLPGPVEQPKFDDLGFVPEDDPEDSTGSVEAGAEGALQGAIGPLAVPAEKLFGVKPEAILARQNQHPTAHMVGQGVGLIGSSFVPFGQAALIGKVGSLINAGEKAAALTKIGAAAAKYALEGGLFGASDEITKKELNDPNQTASSAAYHIGANGLFGAGLGALQGAGGQTLKLIGKTKIGNAAAQLLADFGDRVNFHKTTPDIVGAMKDELDTFHQSNMDLKDQIYGSGQFKNNIIDKLSSEVPRENLLTHVNQVNRLIDDAPEDLTKNKEFQNAISDWQKTVTHYQDPMGIQPTYTPEASDVFRATDQLKRRIGDLAEFNKSSNPMIYIPQSDRASIYGAQSLFGKIGDTLEDGTVWGKLGDTQARLNKTVSDFIPAQKDFMTRFTDKMLGDRVVSPGKINTYTNQLGKPAAEIKQVQLKNYIEAAEKYRNAISDIAGENGVSSPVAPISLNATKQSLNEITPGAEMADKLFNGIIPKYQAAGSVGLGALGGYEGYKGGGLKGAAEGASLGILAPFLLKSGINIAGKYGPAMAMKVLSTGYPRAMGDALEHAKSFETGSRLMQNHIDSLFTGGRLSLQEPSKNAIDGIRKYVEERGLDNELQDEEQKAAIPPTGHDGYAEGGTVKRSKITYDNSQNHFAMALPQEHEIRTQAKGRVYNYLSSLMPQDEVGKLAFDKTLPDPHKQRQYENALKLAASPAQILHDLKGGTLTNEKLDQFKTMWPEVHDQLSKVITKRIVKAQMNDETPPYHIRKSMSHFLGTPLESSFTPQMVQAAQLAFSAQKDSAQAQPQDQGKPKKNISKLDKVAGSYRTIQQAADERQLTQR